MELLYGAENPNVLAATDALAEVLSDLGMEDEARELFQRVLDRGEASESFFGSLSVRAARRELEKYRPNPAPPEETERE
jgi:hypothetical protein